MQTFPLATYSSVSYNDIAKNGHEDPCLVRQANLVLNDPYYSLMYARMVPELGHMETVKKLIEAGCFDDLMESRIEYPTHFLSAPYPQIRSLYESAQQSDDKTRKAIIISTGSYDPLHDGHLETIVLAKEHIENMGNNTVIAGFVSSSHDTYVRRKNVTGVIDYQRVHNNTVFAEASKHNRPVQWIFHESWETLGVKYSLNFTDVIAYISQMVETYVGPDIDIYYVFGSDNAGFAMAFAHDRQDLAKAICIGRPGYALTEETAELIASNSNLSFVQGDNPMSSTLIRSLQTNQILAGTSVAPLVVRNDIEESTEWMKKFFSIEDLKTKQTEFWAQFDNELLKSFTEVRYIDVPQQILQTKKFLDEHHPQENILSCDVYFEGDLTIRCSRLFDIASSQSHGKSTHFITPVADDDGREYVFVDDDIVSGFFLSEIKKHYIIKSAISMADIVIKDDYIDIVDARDFLIGAVHSGLLMDAPTPFRAPYLSPFVDLISRASIPADNIRSFNRTMWRANKNFYAGTGITVADLDASHIGFLSYLKFDGDAEIETICEMYEEIFAV
jgi:nicotinic acid mononucleotide adenylyltransferase